MNYLRVLGAFAVDFPTEELSFFLVTTSGTDLHWKLDLAPWGQKAKVHGLTF